MSRRGLLWMATGAALAVGGTRAVARGDGEEKPPAKRSFAFTYRVRVPAPALGSKRLEAWVPVPLQDELQSVVDLKIEASVAHDIGTDDPYGNRMVHVVVEDPKAEVTIGWTATITRTEDRGQGAGPVFDRYRQADALVPVSGLATRLAEKIDVMKADDPVRARAKRVYDEVLATMEYDKTAPGWGRGDFERACEVGKGNCTDFHAKFTGISRAAGIPVRFTMGIPLSTEAKGSPAGYHCWAHFHDGERWVPVDISEAKQIREKDAEKAQWFFGHLDPDRVALTVGRDLVLRPKQQGKPLLFFAFPYVEVDGQAVELGKDTRTMEYENR